MPSLNKSTLQQLMPVFFKLLHDALFILLVFFALSLTAESLLPGIVASHFGLSKFVVLILGNVFAITLTARFLQFKHSLSLANKKMILFISFFGIVLILNSLLKLNFVLNLFITALAVGTAYLFYLIILQEDLER